VIGVVIATFNPDYRLVKNIEMLSTQVDYIVIVDNGSFAGLESLYYYFEVNEKITVIKNKDNLGLAAALNLGIRHLTNLVEWVLLFDQDSIVDQNYAIKAISAFLHAEEIYGDVGQLSPIYFNDNTRSFISFSESPEDDLNQVFISMTSGSLFKMKNFILSGLFREDYFIDFVDFEYCLRLRKLGFKTIEARDIKLNHQLGKTAEKRIFGRYKYITNHDPLRKYYKTRNRIITYKEYFLIFPAWVASDVLGMIRETISILLFENQKLRKFSKMALGIAHALSNRMGKS
jgi:rhamnosyltransferase